MPTGGSGQALGRVTGGNQGGEAPCNVKDSDMGGGIKVKGCLYNHKNLCGVGGRYRG